MAPVLAGQYGPEGLEFTDGRPARNALVTIRHIDGTMATLYLDKDKATAGPNPLHADGLGNVWFYAVPGEYRLVVNGATIPIAVPMHPDEPALTSPVVDWFTGDGPPSTVIGAGYGDMYVDESTGILYQLR